MVVSRIQTFITVPVFAALYSFTAVVVLILLMFAWLNFKGPIRIISQFWAKSLFTIMGKKLHVHGIENIEKGERYILIANHASLFDIVAIMSFYRGVTWFGHERLLKIPLFGRVLKMTDYVPFTEATVTNTRHMLDQLKQNSKKMTVAIFPEGTRTPDGRINDFYKGFIHLFRNSDIGILPVTLNGFYLLKPKNRFSINFRSKLDVIIHKPIRPEELIDKSNTEILNAVKTIVESAYH
jgi:1-acyl-sn-glycerol-3-phosphate acyltransferase